MVEQSNGKPYLAVMTRAGFSYHGQVFWGILSAAEQVSASENLVPIPFFCKEPNIPVLYNQMHEMYRNGNYKALITVGSLSAQVAQDFCRNEKPDWNIPIVMTGISDPVEQGLLKQFSPQGNVTGVFREQIDDTLIAGALLRLKPLMKKILVPFYDGAEQGTMELRMSKVKHFYEQHNIIVKLLKVASHEECRQQVLEQLSAVDTLIIPEGSFVESLTKFFGKICSERGVTLVSHNYRAQYEGAAITFAQDVEDIGQEAYALANKIAFEGQKPQDTPLIILPNKKKLYINVFAAHSQGIDIESPALFCLRKGLSYEQ